MNRAARRAQRAQPEPGMDQAALVDGEVRRIAEAIANAPEWASFMPWEKAMATEGGFLNMQVSKEPDGSTLSREAVLMLRDNFDTWLMSRLLREWQAKGVPPAGLRVRVNVEIGWPPETATPPE